MMTILHQVSIFPFASILVQNYPDNGYLLSWRSIQKGQEYRQDIHFDIKDEAYCFYNGIVVAFRIESGSFKKDFPLIGLDDSVWVWCSPNPIFIAKVIIGPAKIIKNKLLKDYWS